VVREIFGKLSQKEKEAFEKLWVPLEEKLDIARIRFILHY